MIPLSIANGMLIYVIYIFFSIEVFKAPYNVLRIRDLEENQYNAQFISPILSVALIGEFLKYSES